MSAKNYIKGLKRKMRRAAMGPSQGAADLLDRMDKIDKNERDRRMGIAKAKAVQSAADRMAREDKERSARMRRVK